MNLRPLNDRVIVVPLERERKTSGGIVIPDTAREKPQEGKVVAAGPGRMDKNGVRTPMGVRAGQKILFGKYAGSEIKIDGLEHLIMREDDIIGIINE